MAARSIYELTLNEIVLHNCLKQVVKKFEVVIINPEPTFDIGNSLVSTNGLIKKRFDHGYNAAANQKYESFKSK